jgi:hypothetical protein
MFAIAGPSPLGWCRLPTIALSIIATMWGHRIRLRSFSVKPETYPRWRNRTDIAITTNVPP